MLPSAIELCAQDIIKINDIEVDGEEGRWLCGQWHREHDMLVRVVVVVADDNCGGRMAQLESNYDYYR